MASLSYDLIVLGNDFAGLIAASLCASRGMRVLLAEPRKPITTYRIDKEVFPTAPLVLAGLERPGCQRVLAELHFEHTMRRKLVERRTPFQLLAPRLRLELATDRDPLQRALLRELGCSDDWLAGSAATQRGLDELLESSVCIPGTGFWERRELGKKFPEAHTLASNWLGADRRDSEFLLAQLCHRALSHSATDAPVEMARNVASALQGIPSLPGGQEAWNRLFLEKLQSHSGERRLIVPQRIETSWGKVVGLSAVDDEIRCEHLIAAMPPEELVPLLDAKAEKRLLQQGTFPSPWAYRYTLNLLVHTSGVPEGLSTLAASLLDPGEDPRGGNFALISHESAHGAGKSVITLEAFAPVDDEGRPRLEGMREAVLAHAEDRMPFLSAHIELADSPHEDPAVSHKRDLGEPLAPRAIWEAPIDGGLHLSALGYATGTKQMWLAGDASLPGLALEGQFVAGYGAAKLVSPGKGKSAPKPSVLSASGS